MCGVMPVTTWTRRERFKVVGVHVVVGSGTLAHVVSLVAIIVTVIDHKVLVTRDWSTGVGTIKKSGWSQQYRFYQAGQIQTAPDLRAGAIIQIGDYKLQSQYSEITIWIEPITTGRL